MLTEDGDTEPPPNIPAFIVKLWHMVCDSSTDDIISWSTDNDKFIIKDQARLTANLLPKYYKHNNMASFIRQLNKYGFHKINSPESMSMKNYNGDLEFSHPSFVKGKSKYLSEIKRKLGPNTNVENSSAYVTKLESDIERLKSKQDSYDAKLLEMDALWREHSITRQQLHKQSIIINKLIQFLVSLVRNSATSKQMLSEAFRQPQDRLRAIRSEPNNYAVTLRNVNRNFGNTGKFITVPSTSQNSENWSGANDKEKEPCVSTSSVQQAKESAKILTNRKESIPIAKKFEIKEIPLANETPVKNQIPAKKPSVNKFIKKAPVKRKMPKNEAPAAKKKAPAKKPAKKVVPVVEFADNLVNLADLGDIQIETFAEEFPEELCSETFCPDTSIEPEVIINHLDNHGNDVKLEPIDSSPMEFETDKLPENPLEVPLSNDDPLALTLAEFEALPVVTSPSGSVISQTEPAKSTQDLNQDANSLMKMPEGSLLYWADDTLFPNSTNDDDSLSFPDLDSVRDLILNEGINLNPATLMTLFGSDDLDENITNNENELVPYSESNGFDFQSLLDEGEKNK